MKYVVQKWLDLNFGGISYETVEATIHADAIEEACAAVGRALAAGCVKVVIEPETNYTGELV
mgnify:FL=1